VIIIPGLLSENYVETQRLMRAKVNFFLVRFLNLHVNIKAFKFDVSNPNEFLNIVIYNTVKYNNLTTVKPVLNGISRDQKIFPLKPGFRLIKVHYIQYKKLNQDMQTLTLR
jgi:hypothetical protein